MLPNPAPVPEPSRIAALARAVYAALGMVWKAAKGIASIARTVLGPLASAAVLFPAIGGIVITALITIGAVKLHRIIAAHDAKLIEARDGAWMHSLDTANTEIAVAAAKAWREERLRDAKRQTELEAKLAEFERKYPSGAAASSVTKADAIPGAGRAAVGSNARGHAVRVRAKPSTRSDRNAAAP